MRGLLLLGALSLALLSAAERKPPNILFIFADDQCHDTIAALGTLELDTPNLDQLVAQGTSFTNTSNMGAWNGAVCIASRTMILSGRTLWHAEALDNAQGAQQLVEKQETWPQLLKQAGYETFFTGKWHTKVPPKKIFDHVENVRPGMPRDTKTGYRRPLADGSDPWDPADPKFGGFWEGGKHWSEVVADDAESYFEITSQSDKPFFFYLAFNAPHDPRQAPQAFLDKYPADEMAVPTNFLPRYPHMEAMGLVGGQPESPRVLRDENLALLPRTEHAVQVHRREYYALISHLDAQVGRILRALDESGQRDNTLIIYSADHGLACGQHGLLGKQSMYEHSLKPPLILAGPGIPKGERREALVQLQDILPTTLEVAGIEKPEFIEFESLLPLVEKKSAGHDTVIASYINAQRMIRKGDYKLIVYPRSKTLRLFNLAEDPAERHDLIDDPAQSERISQLRDELITRLKEHGDPLALQEALAE